MGFFEWGQKAANNGKTPVAPKGSNPQQAQQFEQGHQSQKAKNDKK